MHHAARAVLFDARRALLVLLQGNMHRSHWGSPAMTGRNTQNAKHALDGQCNKRLTETQNNLGCLGRTVCLLTRSVKSRSLESSEYV